MSWTFGAEHELVDWDRRRPHSFALDQRDVTMVNSNGIAVDPRARIYWQGGELNTAPTDDPEGQGEQLQNFLELFPESSVNYRSNLHVHVRVPGLREDLLLLKRVQRFQAKWMPRLFPLIEPIPEPSRSEYQSDDAYRGARKRYARRKVSHQRMMSTERLARQYKSRTIGEFFEAEALHAPTGKLHWAIAPRCAVNLRQLRETDTVEFRHFPGTLSPDEVVSTVRWCRDFMSMAIEDVGDPTRMWEREFSHRPWPMFCPYDHELEANYQLTAVHLVGEEMARRHIARILKKKKKKK